MTIQFSKYQGTGNDFVLLDNRGHAYDGLTESQIHKICDRRFGIGADGLMLLQERPGYDFEMIYYNADGRPGSMCGNGGRCIVQFAQDQGIDKPAYHFIATDGPHDARIETGAVSLKMKDVNQIDTREDALILDTGSPHYITARENLDALDVFTEGRRIRNSAPFAQEGINVNFVEQQTDGSLKVRTYERGVEDETFSCGTGVTASALAFYKDQPPAGPVFIHTLGGNLEVRFEKNQTGGFTNIWLKGPATKVFEGSYTLNDQQA
ncbi:diaminopimelate epimerase [Niabella terrae]